MVWWEALVVVVALWGAGCSWRECQTLPRGVRVFPGCHGEGPGGVLCVGSFKCIPGSSGNPGLRLEKAGAAEVSAFSPGTRVPHVGRAVRVHKCAL